MQPGTHITQFELERWTAGELSAAAVHDFQEHVAACPACAHRLEALRTDIQAFTQEVPYAAFRIEHEARRAHEQRRTRRWHLWLPALASAAAIAGAVIMLVSDPTATTTPDSRRKGDGTSLSLLVQHGGRLQGAMNGDVVQTGTPLQLSYDAGNARYMAVLGVDESGAVSLYFPETALTAETRLAPLPAGAAGVLPFSLTLDGTPGAERFIAVFARDAAPLQPVLAALSTELRPRAGEPDADLVRSSRPLVLPQEYAQSSVWVTRP